jgi:UPF0288 family protein (methanogenesis marker protein 3)
VNNVKCEIHTLLISWIGEKQLTEEENFPKGEKFYSTPLSGKILENLEFFSNSVAFPLVEASLMVVRQK